MISTRRLAELCRRAAVSLHAGLDVRGVMRREAGIGPASHRTRMEAIGEQVDDGVSLADAMAAQQGYFPSLAVEMVHVGEQTGKLERVFLQLAEHYENLLALRRVFLLGLIWPALQLAMALSVVGLLIWIMGPIAPTNLDGEPVDLIGLGLKGTSGLIIYLNILLAIAVVVMLLVVAISRGWFTSLLMPLLLRVPILGRCLKYSALSRLAWSLSMAIDAGMDATDSLRLALRGSQNRYYSDLWPRVQRTMGRRCPMSEALRETERFPEDFLIALETGEISGMISETLERQADEYRERAKALMRTLTAAMGIGCMMFAGGLIILLIIRLAMYYLGTIYDALDMINQ